MNNTSRWPIHYLVALASWVVPFYGLVAEALNAVSAIFDDSSGIGVIAYIIAAPFVIAFIGVVALMLKASRGNDHRAKYIATITIIIGLFVSWIVVFA